MRFTVKDYIVFILGILLVIAMGISGTSVGPGLRFLI